LGRQHRVSPGSFRFQILLAGDLGQRFFGGRQQSLPLLSPMQGPAAVCQISNLPATL
jgi:hypothetical protein